MMREHDANSTYLTRRPSTPGSRRPTRSILHPVLVAVLLLMTQTFAVAPASSQDARPGGEARRDFGPLSIECNVDSSHVWSSVTLSMRGKVVARHLLTPDSAEYRFALSVSGDSAGGTIRLNPASPPQFSSVEGMFVTRTAGGEPVRFQGSIATWQAPENAIYIERSFMLSPQLGAHTVVRGASLSDVTVTLLSGETPLYTVAMVQGSPVAVIDSAIILGDAWFAPGTRFTLTIPTPVQTGQVFMQGQFRSAGIPATTISAAIAMWSM